MTATKAVEKLKQIYGKPFFLAVGFTKPHLPQNGVSNVTDGTEWILWLSDYPNLNMWRVEMNEIKSIFVKTGKVKKDISRRECRASLGFTAADI